MSSEPTPPIESGTPSTPIMSSSPSVDPLTARVAALEQRFPSTSWTYSQNFFKRALAIWGHVFVIQLIIAVVIWGLIFACTILFGLSIAGLSNR